MYVCVAVVYDDVMSSPVLMSMSLPTPQDFPAFPYNPPYSIQTELMRHLYSSIEQRKVTIVESPTGTVSAFATILCSSSEHTSQGKTLSLLCASLTWLSDNKNRYRKLSAAAGTSSNGMCE